MKIEDQLRALLGPDWEVISIPYGPSLDYRYYYRCAPQNRVGTSYVYFVKGQWSVQDYYSCPLGTAPDLEGVVTLVRSFVGGPPKAGPKPDSEGGGLMCAPSRWRS